MPWTDPRATPIDLAAIAACLEERWRTAEEVRESIELGRGCNAHPDTPHRVYPSKPKKSKGGNS